MISPHGTEHPHGTQDIPHGTHDVPHGTHDIPTVLNTPTVLSTPHGTAHTLYRVITLFAQARELLIFLRNSKTQL